MNCKEAKMVDLPKKKVGIVACSGEELPEGTVTRLAALKVLEKMRPGDTVTICLPLFLAGGEGDRAFARFYPTIAVDGCEQRCAARATEKFSGKPAASLVVSELVKDNGAGPIAGMRRLNQAGQQAVDTTAEHLAGLVDDLLGKRWDRRRGEFPDQESMDETESEAQEEVEATCACGSGIPIQKLTIDNQEVVLVALPLIFEKTKEAGKAPSAELAQELLDTVKIYNPIPVEHEESYSKAILRAYTDYYATPVGA
jgi:uncharacterized metal-binding protein